MKMPTTAQMGAFLGTGCLIASLLNIANKKAFAVAPAKTDSCMEYQKKAMYFLTKMESSANYDGPAQGRQASISSAYSGYYLVCRDLESRK